MSHQIDDVRDRRDVLHTDDLVRDYSPLPHHRCYAYRDGDTHVVVSKGDEPAERWVREAPATLTRPIEGQRLWTIPDNWETFARSTRETIAYEIHYVPETDSYVELSVPTNDHLVDAWYGVQSVGDLIVEPASELGTPEDVWEAREAYVESHGEDDVAAVLKTLVDAWIHVETELGYALEQVRDERLPEPTDAEPISADDEWMVTFPNYYVRIQDAIEREYEFPGDRTALSIALDELRDAGVLPRQDAVRLSVTSMEQDTEYVIRGLVGSSASASAALDYAMVTSGELTQTEWATERGVDQSTVSENVRKAERVLDGK